MPAAKKTAAATEGAAHTETQFAHVFELEAAPPPEWITCGVKLPSGRTDAIRLPGKFELWQLSALSDARPFVVLMQIVHPDDRRVVQGWIGEPVPEAEWTKLIITHVEAVTGLDLGKSEASEDTSDETG